MDDTSGAGEAKSNLQRFHESQLKRLTSPWDRQKARTMAIKDLFGGSPDLADGTLGASPTDDPTGAQTDLLQELKNEQQQRARTGAVKNLYGFGG